MASIAKIYKTLINISSVPLLGNRFAKRACVGFDLLLFHSVGVLIFNKRQYSGVKVLRDKRAITGKLDRLSSTDYLVSY